jgi:hypothetical protein
MELIFEYYGLIEQLIQIGGLFDLMIVARFNLYFGNERLSILPIPVLATGEASLIQDHQILIILCLTTMLIG